MVPLVKIIASSPSLPVAFPARLAASRNTRIPCNSGYVDRDPGIGAALAGTAEDAILLPGATSRCGVGDLVESFDGSRRKIAVGHDGDRPELYTRQHRQVRVGNDQRKTPANRLGTQIRGKGLAFDDEFTVPQCASAVAATQRRCFRLLPVLRPVSTVDGN